MDQQSMILLYRIFAYNPLKNRSLSNDLFESFFIKVGSRKVLAFGTKLTGKNSQ